MFEAVSCCTASAAASDTLMQQHKDGFPCRSIIAVVGFRFLRLGDLESFLEDAERAAGDGHNDESAEDRLGEGVPEIHTHMDRLVQIELNDDLCCPPLETCVLINQSISVMLFTTGNQPTVLPM